MNFVPLEDRLNAFLLEKELSVIGLMWGST